MFLAIFHVVVLITGVLMSLGHFAQAHKMYSRKSAKDVSLGFISVFMFGSYIWLIYGLLIQDIIIIISFGIAVIGTTVVFSLKLKYDKIDFRKKFFKKNY